MSDSIIIEPLARHRALFPVLAQWFVNEWPAWYGDGGPGKVRQDLEDFAASERALPIGFVALRAGKPIGAGALKSEFIPSHTHLRPWAAAGYVLPELRGQGVGAAILFAMVSHAQSLGFQQVYCGTRTAESLLIRCGWSSVEVIQHAGKPLTIFRSAALSKLLHLQATIPHLICFNKPYGVLSQFTPEGRWRGLKDFIDIPGIYVAGRLDADSEGLLLLTGDGRLQARIADPRFKLEKTYWVQLEGELHNAALATLRAGVQLNDGLTLPARAQRIDEPPALWQRDPPIRTRKSQPTSWLELVIREGRNRQVRRMTAAVGFPTLRLVRAAVGPFSMAGLMPGSWCDASDKVAGIG